MIVQIPRGRHRRPKRRLAHVVAAALLVVLLTAVPASPTRAACAERPAVHTTVGER